MPASVALPLEPIEAFESLDAIVKTDVETRVRIPDGSRIRRDAV